ncbi:hypothetical protein I3760_09G083000 [Carya illinoinensis]|nr:hypothetical protein I3760_09G083000 [Carya illinoinensis]
MVLCLLCFYRRSCCVFLMGMFLSAYHIFRLNVYINVLCCFFLSSVEFKDEERWSVPMLGFGDLRML